MKPIALITATWAIFAGAWGLAVVTPGLAAVVTADGRYLARREPAASVIDMEARS